jgi:photoactive yellow protein
MSADFYEPDIAIKLAAASESDIDTWAFGVMGIDAQTLVRLYNAHEVKLAGLGRERVLGHPLFTTVAPCMNNFMVAQRFEDAARAGTSLDTTIAYVLTLRMRPTKVKLRLIARPQDELRYVLVVSNT